jgi:hypothetical protein
VLDRAELMWADDAGGVGSTLIDSLTLTDAERNAISAKVGSSPICSATSGAGWPPPTRSWSDQFGDVPKRRDRHRRVKRARPLSRARPRSTRGRTLQLAYSDDSSGLGGSSCPNSVPGFFWDDQGQRDGLVDLHRPHWWKSARRPLPRRPGILAHVDVSVDRPEHGGVVEGRQAAGIDVVVGALATVDPVRDIFAGYPAFESRFNEPIDSGLVP